MPSPKSSILLRGGTVLIHSADDHVLPLFETDVLIRGNIIADVGKNLSSPSGEQADTEVIDCTGKIVTPGFVDTHHHLWQTQLKGRHADEGLISYMVSGNMMSYAYTPSDTYFGQLSGCLEAVNAGTTTVLDHAHIACSAEHATSALAATLDSGIRSIFAYTVPMRMSQWDQSSCVPNHDLLPQWALSQLGDWVQKFNGPQSDFPTVEVGMGFDLWFLPKEMVLGMLEKLRGKGLRLLTAHCGRNAFMGLHSAIPMFSDYKLLRPPFPPSDRTSQLPFLLLSHCNGLSDDDLSLLASTGTPISSTPDTESQMGMSYPVALHPPLTKTSKSNVSLGVDCHSSNPSSIPLQARALLHLTRVECNARILAEGKFPAGNVRGTTEEVFNLATIRGARCLGLDGETGSIAKGKKADIVVFDAQGSVGMLGAAEYDPVVAVVRFSEAADVECVIIDGVVRKRGGKLVNVSVGDTSGKDLGGVGDKKAMPWAEIAEEVRKSQKEIQARINQLGIEQGRKALLGTFGTDSTRLVDAS